MRRSVEDAERPRHSLREIVDRYGPRTPLLIGLAGLAVATLLFATGGPYWLLLVARLAQGIASGMSWVAALSLLAVTTPMEKRGQSMGIALSTITLGVLVGPPLAGFLVEHFGTASPFLFAAVVTLVDGILRIVLVKDSPRVTDDTAGPLAVLRVPGHSPTSWPSPLARPCFLLLNPSCRCTLAPTR